MTKFYLILISFLISFEIKAQTERYIHYNDDGYGSDWIDLFDNGRFELIHDELCYKYIEGAGVFKIDSDTIHLDYFQIFNSKKEVTEIKSSNNTTDVSVQVYSLQDSSIISHAKVFARDTTRQKFDITKKVNSIGVGTFSIPKGKTIKYMRVYAENYIDYVITFAEKYDIDYAIKIFLSENPLAKVSYIGKTNKSEQLIRKRKNKIVFNGNVYKRIKKTNKTHAL